MHRKRRARLIYGHECAVGIFALIAASRFTISTTRMLKNGLEVLTFYLFLFQVVIIQPVDNGNKPHPFGHAIVAGIERYPSKITRRMSKTRQEKRSKVKPFIKVINYNHLMPTRYTLELEGIKGTISADTFKEVSQREDAKKTVKKVLEERYTSGKNRWFFTPLSMFIIPDISPETQKNSKKTQKRHQDANYLLLLGF